MRKFRTGDKVQVMRGKDAGKQGTILKIIEKEAKFGTKKVSVIVEGINKAKRAVKPNPQLGIAGGLIDMEKPIDISNVMYLEGTTPTRIAFKVDEKTGKKVRVSKKTGKVLD